MAIRFGSETGKSKENLANSAIHGYTLKLSVSDEVYVPSGGMNQ
jgi:hypothetical protein